MLLARSARSGARRSFFVERLSLAAADHYERAVVAQRYPQRIILVRHGESEANIDLTLHESKPDAHMALTARGWEQARALGARLRAEERARGEGGGGVQFLVSSYRRTRETLSGVLDGGDWPSRELAPVIEEPRLREQEFGMYQDARAIAATMEARRRIGAFYFRFPDGESGADVHDRVHDLVEDLHRLFRRPAWRARGGMRPKTVVIVTHGLTARLFLMKWFRLSVLQVSGGPRATAARSSRRPIVVLDSLPSLSPPLLSRSRAVPGPVEPRQLRHVRVRARAGHGDARLGLPHHRAAPRGRPLPAAADALLRARRAQHDRAQHVRGARAPLLSDAPGLSLDLALPREIRRPRRAQLGRDARRGGRALGRRARGRARAGARRRGRYRGRRGAD